MRKRRIERIGKRKREGWERRGPSFAEDEANDFVEMMMLIIVTDIVVVAVVVVD